MAKPSRVESQPAVWSAALVCIVACCPAQQRFWIDYPDSAGRSPGLSANLIAVGVMPGSRNFDESRWQQLLPASSLPPLPSRLEAISMFNYFPAAEVTYESLQIDVAMTKADHLLPVLAENLRAPLAVLAGGKRTIAWLEHEPTRIGFDRAFPYDGGSGLVIDFLKRLDPETVKDTAQVSTRIASNPGSKLPSSRVSFGERGSDASGNDAKTREYFEPLLLRLEFTTTASLGARWRPGAERHKLEVACVGAPGSRVAVGVHAGSPAPGAVRFAAVVTIPATGLGRAEVALPRSPALLGMPVWVSASGDSPGSRWTKALPVR